VNAKILFSILLATAAPSAAQFSLEAPLRSTGSQLLAVFEPQRQVLQSSSALIMDGRDESGYGVVISADGHILTKASEFMQLKQPEVVIDKQLYKSVELLAQNSRWDVCLIKVEAQDLKPVEYAQSSDLALGSWVCANGVSSRFRRRLLMGVISAQPHRIKPSGGLVMGVAIKQEEKKGLVVQALEAKGGAHAAGIKKGDVLLSADGKEIKKVEELVEHLKAHHYTGSSVLIELKRGKEELEFYVELMPSHQMKPPPNRNDMMSGDFSERRSDFPRVVQHSILGSSKIVGGPLINLDGQCIGMNIARANRAESFAIPVEELHELAEQMIAESKRRKAGSEEKPGE
jgi:serine protease Do